MPSIQDLRRAAQSLAMLDAILCPEWNSRYYGFSGTWGPGEEMASMRDGSGDDWFLLFDQAGAAIKGFAHELTDGSTLSKNIQSQVPADFASFLHEPAFSMDDATFCYWRETGDSSWSKVSGGPDNDGADDMLALLTAGPAAYKARAEEYFEVLVPLDAVAGLFAHEALDDSRILALNPEADPGFTYGQAQDIGYPRGAR